MNKSQQNNNSNISQKTKRNRARRKANLQNRTNNQLAMLNGVDNPRRLKRSQMFMPTPGLSPCGMNYLKALYGPFGTFPEPPCVPSFIPLPSYKFNAFARGSFAVGSGNCGFVMVNPLNVLNTSSSGVVVAGTGAGWYTDNTFAGNSVAYPPTAGVNNFSTTSIALSSYASAPADALFTRQYRCVGAGIRVRFTGNSLNSNGEAICFREEGNGGALTSVDVGVMLAQQRTIRYTTQMIRNRWSEVIYFPDNPLLLGFLNIPALNAQCPFTLSNMIIFVNGGTPDTTFQYEVSIWYEAVGSNWPSLTRTESDVVALGAVLGAAPVQLDKHEPGIMMKIYKKAIELLPSGDSVLHAAGSVAGSAARSYFQAGGVNAYLGVGSPREPAYARQSVTINDLDD